MTISESEIRWTLGPLSTRDPVALSDEDLLVETIRESESYRAVAVQAVAELHDLWRATLRLRRQHERLVEEYRSHRAHVMCEAAAR